MTLPEWGRKVLLLAIIPVPQYERYLLRKRTQQNGESIESYITELKTMVKRCAIPSNFEDEMIKDQIIFGIIGNAPRERILQEKTMNLRRCTEICIAAEAAGSHAKSIIGNNKTEPDPEVSVIKQGRR